MVLRSFLAAHWDLVGHIVRASFEKFGKLELPVRQNAPFPVRNCLPFVIDKLVTCVSLTVKQLFLFVLPHKSPTLSAPTNAAVAGSFLTSSGP